MSLAVCIFIAWCVIAILALIPKKLTELEMVFLLFVCTIFELSIFTVFHLNLHLLDVNRSVEKSLADLVIRLVSTPVVLVIVSNTLLMSSRFIKWGSAIIAVLYGVIIQKILEWLGILSTPHWNVGYTASMFCVYVVFVGLMGWFIIRVVPREGQGT